MKRVDVQMQVLLTSPVVGGRGGQLHTSAPWPLGNRPPPPPVPSTHCIAAWVGPITSLDNVEKWKFLPLLTFRTVTPSVIPYAIHHYTNCTILIPPNLITVQKFKIGMFFNLIIRVYAKMYSCLVTPICIKFSAFICVYLAHLERQAYFLMRTVYGQITN